MADRGPPHRDAVGLSVTSHYVYVDNFGVQAVNKPVARSGLNEVIRAFEEKQLTVHGTELQCEEGHALGHSRWPTTGDSFPGKPSKAYTIQHLRRPLPSTHDGLRIGNTPWPLHTLGSGEKTLAELFPHALPVRSVNDNDTLREVQHLSDEGLALQARV